MSGKVHDDSTIRPLTRTDVVAVLELLPTLGLFGSDDLAEMAGTIEGCLDGSAGPGHLLLVDVDEASSLTGAGEASVHDDTATTRVIGIAYVAPERMTEGTWNLYLIGIHPDRRGTGRGRQLIVEVEATVAAAGGRMLLVETAGLDSFEPQRTFYRRAGFEAEAVIRDFYDVGVDKVVFRKLLTAASA